MNMIDRDYHSVYSHEYPNLYKQRIKYKLLNTRSWKHTFILIDLDYSASKTDKIAKKVSMQIF